MGVFYYLLLQTIKYSNGVSEDRHNAPTAVVGIGNVACTDGVGALVPTTVRCASARAVDRDTARSTPCGIPTLAPRLVGGGGIPDGNLSCIPHNAIDRTLRPLLVPNIYRNGDVLALLVLSVRVRGVAA